MFRHPAVPVVVGTLLTVVLVAGLAVLSPQPGNMSLVHAQVPQLQGADGCKQCHAPAGLDQGCLGCHKEIASQLENERGYHAYLSKSELAGEGCGSCHGEHFGAGFELVNQESWGAQTQGVFRHPHVDFQLEGAHERIPCDDCHQDLKENHFRLEEFPGHPRLGSFLGLDQQCQSCHQDQHTDGVTGSCAHCHGQETFQPPVSFDHSEHFPFTGGHDDLQCADCHELPSRSTPPRPFPFPFDKTPGNTCDACHQTPHRTEFSEPCQTCHAVEEDHWTGAAARLTTDLHQESGFPLHEPHASVACDQCHPTGLSFDERHPDPTAPGYLRHPDTCQGCHEDVHQGQFGERSAGCLSCHEKHRFKPPRFGRSDHASVFLLQGAHEAVVCTGCHQPDPQGVRQFVGTSHECRVCHEDPHAGQFADRVATADCTACHRSESDTFSMRPFDHQLQTGHELKGAHAKADCEGCHRPHEFPDGRTAQRYVDTPTECSSCHTDIHRGQFRHHESCQTCHTSLYRWTVVEFDHNTQARFKLEGAHTEVPCSGCHMPLKLEDGTDVVQYRPLRRECGDCHEIEEPLRRKR